MKPPKKTLYELLELTDSASTEAVQQAHARLLARLQAERQAHNGEAIDFRIQTLNVAFTTLASPTSRQAYDARLAQEQRSLRARITSDAPVKPHREPDESAWSRDLPPQAQAILRRAQRHAPEALADADDGASPVMRLLSAAKSSLTKSLVFIGLLAVLGTLLQVLVLRSHIAAAPPSEARMSAEEKVMLQEYFQVHGVRPASRADVDVLEQERRSKEQAEREAARKKEKEELDQRRFEQEARRRADQVSASLRRAEEAALNRALAQP